MAALDYAMDSVLYMTTGILDRHDEDIMVETAICKVFCSEMGWRVVNDGMQIMGGEGYMTENEVERVFATRGSTSSSRAPTKSCSRTSSGTAASSCARADAGREDFALLKDPDELMGAYLQGDQEHVQHRIMKIAVPLGAGGSWDPAQAAQDHEVPRAPTPRTAGGWCRSTRTSSR
jgi:hypothetical protein